MGRRALAAAERLLGPTAYARVDIVERADGEPAVLELELLDPVLFFVEAPQAAPTFAARPPGEDHPIGVIPAVLIVKPLPLVTVQVTPVVADTQRKGPTPVAVP